LLRKTEIRNQIRKAFAIRNDQILVMNVGRISRDKGTFDLIEAVSLAAAHDPRIVCLLIGSVPAFDDTVAVQKEIAATKLTGRVKLFPACDPGRVWDYLCAADIFAFTSHKEGMPNSLLEAMAIGLPAVAFAIPPVLEIKSDTGCLISVPPLDTAGFSDALLRLARSPAHRAQIGQLARRRVMDRFMVKKNMALALQRLSHLVEKRHSRYAIP
jgi:glycosyltransferase involved in cell wall biosynthesis